MERFLNLLGGLPDIAVYLLLGLSAYVENIFPPIPGDTITAFGAFLVGTGRLDFFFVYLSTTLGSLLGFLTLFWAGRLLGRRFFFEKDYLFFRARNLLYAEAWFARYGYFLIALNRFFPGIRSAVSLAAGISRLKTAWVAPLALVSCAAWNLLWIGLGHTLGTRWDLVQSKFSTIMSQYNMAVAILVILLVLFWLVRKRIRKGRF